jgi:hypothetical protein
MKYLSLDDTGEKMSIKKAPGIHMEKLKHVEIIERKK